MSAPWGIPTRRTHRHLSGNKNKKEQVGFHLFICLFYFVSARDRKISIEKLLLRTAGDPRGAFRSWYPDMCIFFYCFLEGRRAKRCFYFHYAQLFHTFRTKGSPGSLVEDSLALGCLFQISKTVPWPESMGLLIMSPTQSTSWTIYPQWSRGHPDLLPGVKPSENPSHVASFDA